MKRSTSKRNRGHEALRDVSKEELIEFETKYGKDLDAFLKSRLKQTKTISHDEVRRRIKGLLERISKKKRSSKKSRRTR